MCISYSYPQSHASSQFTDHIDILAYLLCIADFVRCKPVVNIYLNVFLLMPIPNLNYQPKFVIDVFLICYKSRSSRYNVTFGFLRRSHKRFFTLTHPWPLEKPIDKKWRSTATFYHRSPITNCSNAVDFVNSDKINQDDNKVLIAKSYGYGTTSH